MTIDDHSIVESGRPARRPAIAPTPEASQAKRCLMARPSKACLAAGFFRILRALIQSEYAEAPMRSMGTTYKSTRPDAAEPASAGRQWGPRSLKGEPCDDCLP